MLIEVEAIGRYRLLGDTLDDAAGEAFDKTAKLMGLPYPGRPGAGEAGRTGPARRVPLLAADDRPARARFQLLGPEDPGAARLAGERPVSDQTKADVARAFEDAIVETLAIKCRRALAATGARSLVVAGGVGANRELRARAGRGRREGRFPHVFPAAGVLHRQRRDDRARRRAAACRPDSTKRPAIKVQPRWDLASLPPVA